MLAPRARKQLARLSRTDRERLTRAMAALPDGDVRHLVGHDDEWRLRVGDWRVRYRLNFEQRVIEASCRAAAHITRELLQDVSYPARLPWRRELSL